MFGFRCNAGYTCAAARVSSYAISGTGREWIQPFVCLVQYGTTGICPPFCSKDLFVTILKCGFMLISIFNSTVQSIPVSATACDRPGSVDARSILRSESKVLGLLCTQLHRGVLQYGYKEKPHRPKYQGTRIRIVLWCTFVEKTKTFLLRVATLATGDLTGTNFAQWSNKKNSRPSVSVVHRLAEGPVGYNKQSHPTSIQTILHSAFWPQHKDEKLHPRTK
jgi:hypothetical protein